MRNSPSDSWKISQPTAVLVLADGTVIFGKGTGFEGTFSGEVCFNTSMTGYQEILTDPSYAGQIVTFTFPHIGNVGSNDVDNENVALDELNGVKGVVMRADITSPSNFRSNKHLNEWLKFRKIIGITGVDTRALTALIRKKGMPNAVICHHPEGNFDLKALKEQAASVPSLIGQNIAFNVTNPSRSSWSHSSWTLGKGYTNQESAHFKFHVVAVDFGIKCNILRRLVDERCNVTVVPADTKYSEILNLKPDGVFLSNGPGDPAATGKYVIQTIQDLINKIIFFENRFPLPPIPLFGICLGHQLLALSLGCNTIKMHQGHHGANHPVLNVNTKHVEITSMNHGFAVDRESLPENVVETHVSLFDGSNCGIRLRNKPVFSVQFHPEASPGPHDTHNLFQEFREMMVIYKRRLEQISEEIRNQKQQDKDRAHNQRLYQVKSQMRSA